MDAKLINPFINATANVLKTMAFVTPKPGKPYLKKDDVAKGDVTGIIGLTGEANGTISVTFDEGSILKIVSNMFGEEMKELNHEVADAVGELNAGLRRPARCTPDNNWLWPCHGCFSLYSPFRQRIDMLVASLRPP